MAELKPEWTPLRAAILADLVKYQARIEETRHAHRETKAQLEALTRELSDLKVGKGVLVDSLILGIAPEDVWERRNDAR